MPINVFNEVVSLKENKITTIGSVERKFVVTPNIDSLLK